MRELKPCGTRAAYTRHKRRGEDADDACLLANRNHFKGQRANYSLAKQRALEKLATAHTEELAALLKAERESGQPSGTTSRNWKALTRQRALRKLAANHPEDFAALLATERTHIEKETANA